jgi:hypothetical protein
MTVKIFASIGVIATFILVVMFVALIISGIEVLVNDRRYNKRIKNRFKGGPTAKCFCKDCEFYNETSKPDKYNHGAGDCRAHNGWGVMDSWYCWTATPIDYDEAKRREEIEKGR